MIRIIKKTARLLLLFKKITNFPPQPAEFYITKTDINYVTKSGIDYTTRGA